MIFFSKNRFAILSVFILSNLVVKPISAQTNWIKETENSGFDPRDSSPNASVVHNGSVYVLAGYRHIGFGQWESLSDSWKSENGKDWEQLNPTPPYYAYCAFVSFKGKIWAFGEQSYSSEDGVDWVSVNTNFHIPYASRAVVHNGSIYLVSGRMVLKSEDGSSFTQLTSSAQWTSRNWPGFVSFKNKLWFFGGGINYRTGNDFYYSDVWSSADGISWVQETGQSNWPARFWFSYQVFDQKIWAIGGWSYFEENNGEYGNLNDTWYTENGVTWTQVNTEMKFPNRHASLIWCQDGYLWLSSGYGGGGVSRMYNDVWRLKVENDYLKNISDVELAFGDEFIIPQNSSVGLPLQIQLQNNNIFSFSNNSLLAKGVGEVEMNIKQNGNCEYAYAEKMVKIKAIKRDLYTRVNDEDVFFGDPIPPFEISYDGLAFNHTKDSLEVQPILEIDSVASLSLGEHSVRLVGGADSRYTILNQSGILRVHAYTYNSFIFPNPATEFITPVTALGAVTSLSFFNNTGVLVLQTSPDSTGTVSILSLLPGVYQVRIFSEGKSFYTKLLVQ